MRILLLSRAFFEYSRTSRYRERGTWTKFGMIGRFGWLQWPLDLRLYAVLEYFTALIFRYFCLKFIKNCFFLDFR